MFRKGVKDNTVKEVSGSQFDRRPMVLRSKQHLILMWCRQSRVCLVNIDQIPVVYKILPTVDMAKRTKS